MSKEGKKGKSTRSRAEELIEAAVRAVEAKEGVSHGIDVVELQSIDASLSPSLGSEDVVTFEKNRTSDVSSNSDFNRSSQVTSPTREAVAKIDPKQVVSKENYLRLAADFENFRVRAAKEKRESERAGREIMMREILDIIDSLYRGLGQFKTESHPAVEGLKMVLSQAEAILKSQGLERIAAVGQMFDPQIHEAVAHLDDDVRPAGIIIEEIRVGYRWSDRLLRPASVVVSKGRATGGQTSPTWEKN